MTRSAIRLLTLVVGAAALVALPAVTPASSMTSHNNHIKRHKMAVRGSRDFSGRQLDGRAWTVARPPARRARSVQAWAEASIVQYGLLHSMRIPIGRLRALTAAKRG